VDPVTGDRSVKDTWLELLTVAERYIYIEEQYFWIEEHVKALRTWLLAKPDRFLFLLMPRRFSDLPKADQIHYAIRRRRLYWLLYGMESVPEGTDPSTLANNLEARVAMFHIASRENLDPIYVHSKLVIADDTWFTIGSANLTRRSWTFDSEINAACVDTRIRRGGHRSARELRIDLLAEHLQLLPVERPLLEDPRDAFRMVKDVLGGKRPWMRTHLLKVDPKFTHYGPFPEDFDPFLLDAVNLAVDTDGSETQFDVGLIDAWGVWRAVSDDSGGLRYGGLGRLRFTFDVSAIPRPADQVVVRVEMRDSAAPPSQRVTLGPWPAASSVEAGLLHIGKSYSVHAVALDASTSAQLGTWEPGTALTPTDFVTTVNVSF
jgi:hypothetical protein